jgi:hypothetical protein
MSTIARSPLGRNIASDYKSCLHPSKLIVGRRILLSQSRPSIPSLRPQSKIGNGSTSLTTASKNPKFTG